MKQYRRLFPVTESRIYLNHAANSPEPIPVVEAVHDFLTECSTAGTVTDEYWLQLPAKCRQRFARLINCDPADVAFVDNVSHAANLVAGGLDWRAGDNIVVAQSQFPANIYPWLFLQSRGVKVRFAPWQEKGLASAVADLLDERTRVVAVSWVEFFSGQRHDLAPVGKICRERDILFFVDAIQGLGVSAMDVKEIRADVVATGGHKWLLGPEGQGAMYCRRQWLDRLNPSWFSWRSVRDFMNFERLQPDLLPDASRFEAGTPNFPGIIGLGAGLALLQAVGLAAVEQKVAALCTRLIDGLAQLPAQVITPRKPGQRAGIVSFLFPDCSAEQLVAELDRQGIVVSARKNALRVSPHFYNTAGEIDAFLHALCSFV